MSEVQYGQIRDALADALRGIPGVIVYPRWKGAVSPPCLVVGGPENLDYDTTMGRGGDTYRVLVRGFVGRGDDEAAQARLDEWLDSAGLRSVKAAVERDATLGGVVDYARVVQGRNYGDYDVGDVKLLGFEWICEVQT